MKLKVGDKVKVREDLVVNKIYGSNTFDIGMTSLEEAKKL